MAKFSVRAVKREGFDGTWRAGRLWPSGGSVEIEVLDQDDCPRVAADVPVGAAARDMLDPVRLGRKAFRDIEADPRIAIKPAGDLLAAVLPSNSQAVAALKAQTAELDELRAEAMKLAAENGNLKKKVAGLEDLLAETTAQSAEPAPSVDEEPSAPAPVESPAPAAQGKATRGRGHK